MLKLTRKEAETVEYALRVFLDTIQNDDTRATLASDIRRAKTILAIIEGAEYWAIFTHEEGPAERCEWAPLFTSEEEALEWIGDSEYSTQRVD